jgi:transposase
LILIAHYTNHFYLLFIAVLIESAQPIADTAKELGINPNRLYTWINKYSIAPNANGSKLHSDNRAYDELV